MNGLPPSYSSGYLSQFRSDSGPTSPTPTSPAAIQVEREREMSQELSIEGEMPQQLSSLPPEGQAAALMGAWTQAASRSADRGPGGRDLFNADLEVVGLTLPLHLNWRMLRLRAVDSPENRTRTDGMVTCVARGIIPDLNCTGEFTPGVPGGIYLIPEAVLAIH